MFKTIWNQATILIRVSEKCSSNCLSCKLPYVKENFFYELHNFWKILDFIDEKFSDKFEIWILWFNLIDNLPFDLFNNFKRNFSMQISFNDVKKLEWRKFWKNIFFWIQETVNNLDDFKRIIKFLNYIEEKKIYISINILINFIKFEKILKYFKEKYKFQYSQWLYKIFLWKNILEFENSAYLEDSIILWNKDCIAFENFYLNWKDIYIKDDLEIKLNWDIKFHLNHFCNKWIWKISNIFYENEKIFYHFKKLQKILQKREKSDFRCKNCISNPLLFDE